MLTRMAANRRQSNVSGSGRRRRSVGCGERSISTDPERIRGVAKSFYNLPIDDYWPAAAIITFHGNLLHVWGRNHGLLPASARHSHFGFGGLLFEGLGVGLQEKTASL